jgi:integrase/recombinase XerD
MEEKFLTKHSRESVLEINSKTQDKERIRDTSVIGSWLYDNDKSVKTQMIYKKIISEFFSYFPNITIKSTTTPHLGAFLKSKDHLEVRSKNLIKSVLSSLFQFCEDIQYIPHNQARALKRTKTPETFTDKILELSEVRRMIEKEDSWRNRLILKTLYMTGVRVSELVQMKLKHFKIRTDGEIQVTVLGKGNKVRSIIIPLELWEEILNFSTLEKLSPKTENDFIFRSQKKPYTGLDPSSVFDVVKQAAKNARISKEPSPHWFRHTSATHAVENGAPIHVIQASLGHSSIQTTGKYLTQRPKESISNYLPNEIEDGEI